MKKLKILLLSPAGCEKEECCSGRLYTKKLPSQIFLTASYLKKNKKDVTVIDLQTQKLPDFNKFDVLAVWVSIHDGFYSDIEFLKKGKQAGLKTIMILNDPYGVEQEVMQNHSFIDYCVRLYEREITIEKLITTLEQNSSLGFSGIIKREGKKIIDNGVMPQLTNLKHLSSSRSFLEKLDLKKYSEAHITAGRGCPMKCTFCMYQGTGIRKREIKEIIDEIQILPDNIKVISFSDINMPADKVWTNQFLDELIKIGNKKEWHCDVRAEQCLDLDFLKKFRKAGCTQMLMGLESADPDIIKKIKKATNTSIVNQAIINIKKAKIIPHVTFMVGFPWDSKETLKSTREFIKSLPTAGFSISFVMPFKGTPLYDDFKNEKLLSKDLSYPVYVDAKYDLPVCRTKYLTKQELLKEYKQIQGIRFTPRYLIRYVSENGFKFSFIPAFFRQLKSYLKK